MTEPNFLFSKSFSMKKYFLLLSLLITISLLHAQERYIRIEISRDQVEQASLAGIATEEGYYTDQKVILEISEPEAEKLAEKGIVSKVLMDDMTKYYSDRAKKTMPHSPAAPGSIPVPDDFTLGSMGGFCTLSELYDHLDNMRSKYPHLITAKSPVTSYTTHEGREIYWVKISDHPDIDETETRVLYTAMIHAREPIGMQQMLFFMYHLLENYETDIHIRQLIDTTELCFIPCVNPDGYEYNRQTAPNGGGMWRKNRRDNQNGSYGVDLNRNFGYQCGYDDIGSSPDPWDLTYRGPSAFSEPETQMIRDFCQNKSFPFALNYHSYSNVLLHPWGYIPDTTEHHRNFSAFAEKLTDYNAYPYGPASMVLYSGNGNSDDWMYGDQTSKPLMYAYTPEVGNSNDGFWPSPDRIVPLCQEQVTANFYAARFAGRFAEVKDKTRLVIPEKSGHLSFSLKRFGLEEGVTYTVSVEPLGDKFLSIGPAKSFANPSMLLTLLDSIDFTLQPWVAQGDEIQYVLTVEDGHFSNRDTLTKIYGTPDILFADDGNSMTNWSSQKWDISTFFYVSPPASITDSRFGNYGSNANTYVFSTPSFDLSGIKSAVLAFNARWETERRYDFIQVKSSSDGSTFLPLKGKFTRPSPNTMVEDQPVYDGIQSGWIYEEINLRDYIGKNIQVMFNLRSNELINKDGFYFDDLKIFTFDDNTSAGETLPSGSDAFAVTPNPVAGDILKIERLNSEEEWPVTLSIYDIRGRECMSRPVRDAGSNFSLSVSSLSPGIYFIKLFYNNRPGIYLKMQKSR